MKFDRLVQLDPKQVDAPLESTLASALHEDVAHGRPRRR
jgi:hypothetical protein